MRNKFGCRTVHGGPAVATRFDRDSACKTQNLDTWSTIFSITRPGRKQTGLVFPAIGLLAWVFCRAWSSPVGLVSLGKALVSSRNISFESLYSAYCVFNRIKMSFHFGEDFGAVDAESESFPPHDTGADLTSSFDPVPLLFDGQQLSAPVPQNTNESSPLVQLSLADLKQVYLEALQTYHQQFLAQAASQLSASSFLQPSFGSGENGNLALQLQLIAQQQQLQLQHAPTAAGFASGPVFGSPPTQTGFSPFQTQSSQFSLPAQNSVFAVPRPIDEDQRLAREARIQKYRAKRLKRKNARPASSLEKTKPLRLRDANGQFLRREDFSSQHKPHVKGPVLFLSSFLHSFFLSCFQIVV